MSGDQIREVPGFENVWIDRGGQAFTQRDAKFEALTQYAHPQGYLKIQHQGRREYVHRLVLMAFVGPCPDGMVACHLNDIPDDNRLENLRWDQQIENVRDAQRNGGRKTGSRHHAASLTKEQVAEIRQRVASGELHKTVAEMFGIQRHCVRAIAAGETYRDCHDGSPIGRSNKKISDGDVAEIVRRRSSGETLAQIALTYGVRESAILYVVNVRAKKPGDSQCLVA